MTKEQQMDCLELMDYKRGEWQHVGVYRCMCVYVRRERIEC